MDPAANGNPRHEVVCSAQIAEHLKQLQEQAKFLGISAQVLSAMKTIQERLIQSPRDFGEPLYHLPALKLEVRMGVVLPVAVEFGVYDEKPLVFIKAFRALWDAGP